MVSFAAKAGKNIRSDVNGSSTSSGGGVRWLRNLRDGKDCRVRFLQDPEDWLKYKEHYGQATKYFPCTQAATCPGCNSDEERMKYASTKYIAQVFIVNEQDAKDVGQVVPLKLTRDLANRLLTRCDRNGGTLLDRDFTLIRKGNDKDTQYDVEVEDRSPFDVNRVQLLDVEKILADIFENVWGAEPEVKPRDEARNAPNSIPGVGQTMRKINPITGAVTQVEGDEPPF